MATPEITNRIAEAVLDDDIETLLEVINEDDSKESKSLNFSLMYAASKGSLSIVKNLVENTNVNIDKFGSKAIDFAIKGDHLLVVEYLLEVINENC